MELSPDGFPRVYCRPIHSKLSIDAFWTGPHDVTARKLPLVLYFSLCAEKSLTLSPYNQFVASMSGLPVRVVSISLPEHGRDLRDEEGMMRWAAAWEKEPKIFSNFFENCRALIDQLIACGEVDEKKIFLAGLSRGAWIATRLASLSPGVHCVMGLAPLLDLSRVREFAERFDSTRLESEALQLNENLLKSHFFYTIGSH
ncbi:MAG: acetylxylan esterase, partial [Chlamydiia bacterium]|nr:acetylxylan esterase [Chlamydiia bacterium]